MSEPKIEYEYAVLLPNGALLNDRYANAGPLILEHRHLANEWLSSIRKDAERIGADVSGAKVVARQKITIWTDFEDVRDLPTGGDL